MSTHNTCFCGERKNIYPETSLICMELCIYLKKCDDVPVDIIVHSEKTDQPMHLYSLIGLL